MKRARPIAVDRELADVLRNLKAGNYEVVVEENQIISYLGRAQLKTEGTTVITLDRKNIFIRPVK